MVFAASLRGFMAAIALFAGLVPVIAAPPRVTGFSYQMPKLTAPDAGLVRYLQLDRAKTFQDYAALFADPDMTDQDFSSFENTTSWTVDSALPGMTILIAGRSSFTGGAHGFAFVETLIWNSRAHAAMRFAELFTNPAAARALLNPAYCRALNRERLVRRGEATDPEDMFGACPDLLKEAAAYPTKPVYGKYSRIGISLAPYVAGPYAEGGYDLEIVIPKGLKALVKPQFHPLFPG